MSVLTYMTIGALVPTLVKNVPAVLKKIFKLQLIDDATKAKVAAKTYPHYYKILYAFWLLCLFSSGFVVFGYFAFYLPASIVDIEYSAYWKFAVFGLINMIGAWFVIGAILDQFFWSLSSENLRDYVRHRNIQEGMDVDVPHQIKILWKIGVGYYMVLSPVFYLLLR